MGSFSREEDLRFNIICRLRNLSIHKLRQVQEFMDGIDGPPARRKKHPKKVSKVANTKVKAG